MNEEVDTPTPVSETDKRILVTRTDGKVFRVTVPAGARLTFGPWSPPTSSGERYANNERALSGTLRIYSGNGAKASILGVFSGVASFRSETLEYEEQIFAEVGSTVWNSDKHGFSREEKVQRTAEWSDPGAPKAVGPGDL